jgi:hypothetical protein
VGAIGSQESGVELAGEAPVRCEAASTGHQAQVFTPAFEVRAHFWKPSCFLWRWTPRDFNNPLAAECLLLPYLMHSIQRLPIRVKKGNIQNDDKTSALPRSRTSVDVWSVPRARILGIPLALRKLCGPSLAQNK